MKNTTPELQNDDHSDGALLFLLFVLVLAFFAVIAEGAQPRTGRESDPSAGASNTLMLVREWDPESGSLIGWLPIHRAAIHMQILDKSLPTHFDLNDVVNIVWVPRQESPREEGRLLVSPLPRVFEGERWLPLMRDANLVRIEKQLFLIRGIIFGESKWRLPNQQPSKLPRPHPQQP